MDPNTFEETMRKAQEGCKQSVGLLLTQYQNYLMAIANARLHPELLAKVGGSDVVQHTFFEAVQSIAEFKGRTAEEFQAWLRQILLHNLQDIQRLYLNTAARSIARERPGADSRPLAEFPAIGRTPSSQVSSLEEVQRLEAALAQLPTEYRLVIELRNRDRMRFAEIGQHLNRSEDAARMLWNRALERLEAELQNIPTDEA